VPRITCPECDEVVKVPKDYERSIIRCPSCEHKIRLDEVEEQEDDQPRRRSRDEVRPIKRKRKKPNAFAQFWQATGGRLDTPLLVIVIISVLSLLLSCIHPIFYVVPMVVGGCLILLGGVLFLLVVVNDSLTELLLCFLVPFYSLYYLIKNWGATCKSFYLQVYGTAFCFSFLCFMPLHYLIYGTRLPGPNNPPVAVIQPPVNAPVGPKPAGGGPGPKKPFEVEPVPPIAPAPPPAKVTGDETLDKLLADLTSKDDFLRRKAADALDAMPPNQHRAAVAGYLAKLSQSPTDSERRTAVPLLATWATAKEVPILIQLLGDKEIYIRNRVLKNIGKLQDPRTVTPVVNCLLEFQTRSNAEVALKEMGPLAEKEVLALLNHPDVFGIRVSAIRILREIGTQQSVPALQAAKGNITLRGSADQALAAIAARAGK
jgi:hypothetical protein